MNLIEEQIKLRYNELATGCCSSLSCGDPIPFARLRPGEGVVDLGCGRGREIIEAARQVGPQGHAVGIDLSEKMLDTAREQAKGQKLSNIEFLNAEFSDLPLPDQSFDAFISNCALNHAPNKPAVLKEVKRVLKPGGRFILSDVFSVHPIPPSVAEDPEAVAACYGGAVTMDMFVKFVDIAGFRLLDVLNKSEVYSKGGIDVFSATLKIS